MLNVPREVKTLASPSAKLLVLCSAAVGAIYATGYVVTQPSAQATKAPASTGSASNTPSSHASRRTHQGQYNDGEYRGSGSNQYGVLSVLLTISQGKIASVRITNYAMHYPQSYIDPTMPDEVIAKQTWDVYGVSGATASSDNFAEAVYNALQKAKA